MTDERFYSGLVGFFIGFCVWGWVFLTPLATGR